MLPNAQKYLQSGGLDPSPAAYTTIGCFLGGVIGIQFVSRILHHYIPSHVVDCDHDHDHNHEDEGSEDEDPDDNDHEDQDHLDCHQKSNGNLSEHTPLLTRSEDALRPGVGSRSQSAMVEGADVVDVRYTTAPSTRTPTLLARPSMQTRLTQRMSTFVTGAKGHCDEGGPCYGYGDPCGHHCLKAVSRSPTRAFGRFSYAGPPRHPSLLRTATTGKDAAKFGIPSGADEESNRLTPPTIFQKRPTMAQAASTQAIFRGRRSSSHANKVALPDESTNGDANCKGSVHSQATDPTEPTEAHHHHVPENAFLAIGLQTSIAIALHKLPEGFITYATNHANPKLGFTVFMALFIHNITEGFAMALPLYLAINSRWKAMFWSSLLGGVSQPLGAGVAALWFKIAGNGGMKPGDTVYGCMFSITAGIMASVALQLFSESLSLTHNRNVCMAFAFLGMGILGVSFALTAG